jgi:hypothetical protein
MRSILKNSYLSWCAGFLFAGAISAQGSNIKKFTMPVVSQDVISIPQPNDVPDVVDHVAWNPTDALTQAAPNNQRSLKEVGILLPTTPQEVWFRTMTLLQKNRGFISRRDAEDVFGMHFTHSEAEGEKRYLGAQYFHSFKQAISGLGVLSISLFEDQKKIGLNVVWGPDNFDLPNCMQLANAKKIPLCFSD